MITIADNSQRKIEDLRDKHFEGLHASLQKRIEKNITDTKVRRFLLTNLKDILIQTPEKLLVINCNFVRLYNSIIKQMSKNSRKIFFSRIVKTFNYDWFIDKKEKKYCAYSLTEGLDIKVCPYCNANFTLTIKTKDGKKLIRPSLDHFFSKSKYPILALSFYNLIPSCNICNSSLKGSSASDLNNSFHPYVHSILNDIEFNYAPRNVNGAIGLNEDFDITLNIRPDSAYKNQIIGHLEMFKLVEIYNQHKDYASEIILKTSMYNGVYLRTLQSAFKELGLSKEEFYRICYSNYLDEKDMSKRPLSKLIRDLTSKYDDYLKL